MDLVVLAGLLVLPAIALYRAVVDWRWVGGYALAINLLTYAAYASDKRRAIEKEWRLPEARLHLLALLGGWLGAFLAQRRLRHKCSRGSFQFVFWLTVIAFQFAAFDSMQHWQFSRAALIHLEREGKRR